ncbi:hypothetical protein BN4901_1884 [Citrobacter europaeus]|uniref:Uncharacterized protein n=1 Tax=Citrobacter europaeus TaxID=1914243 RepID=A0ABY0JN21_9ENTR|nr:hypothetical protein CIP106467_1718 [Citrobacter europaeus]SBW24640.1 hypothetical protein BN4901_1884 [Citrobacter europaeus]
MPDGGVNTLSGSYIHLSKIVSSLKPPLAAFSLPESIFSINVFLAPDSTLLPR